MNSIKLKNTQSIQYPTRTVERADRAIRCSPFQLNLFTAMLYKSVPLQAIVANAGIENHYTASSLSELAVESTLLWLIQVGILRREVDGQGITDSFRLAPLGRQLVEKWQNLGGSLPKPSWRDRIYNTLNRWLRLPI